MLSLEYYRNGIFDGAGNKQSSMKDPYDDNVPSLPDLTSHALANSFTFTARPDMYQICFAGPQIGHYAEHVLSGLSEQITNMVLWYSYCVFFDIHRKRVIVCVSTSFFPLFFFLFFGRRRLKKRSEKTEIYVFS